MKLRTKWTKRILAMLLSASLVLVNDSVYSVALTVRDTDENIAGEQDTFDDYEAYREAGGTSWYHTDTVTGEGEETHNLSVDLFDGSNISVSFEEEDLHNDINEEDGSIEKEKEYVFVNGASGEGDLSSNDDVTILKDSESIVTDSNSDVSMTGGEFVDTGEFFDVSANYLLPDPSSNDINVEAIHAHYDEMKVIYNEWDVYNSTAPAEGQYVVEYEYGIFEEGTAEESRGGEVTIENSSDVVSITNAGNRKKVILARDAIDLVIRPELGMTTARILLDDVDVNWDENYVFHDWEDGGTPHLHLSIDNANGHIPYIKIEFEVDYNYSFNVDGYYDGVEVFYKLGGTSEFTQITQISVDEPWGNFNIADSIKTLGDSFDGKITFKIMCPDKSVQYAFTRDYAREYNIAIEQVIHTEGSNVWEYTLEGVPSSHIHTFGVGLGYDNAGRPDIIDETRRNIFAYANNDYDGNDASNDEDIKFALATELYAKFFRVEMFGSFGLPQDDGLNDEERLAERQRLKNRITLSADSPTPMMNADGESVNVSTKKATINYGVNEETGDPIVCEVPVYLVEEGDFVFQIGGTYYIRNIVDDWTEFDGGQGGLLITSNSFDNIRAGGFGTFIEEYNKSDNLYSMELYTQPDCYTHSNHAPMYKNIDWNYGFRVRIMKNTGTYVQIDTNAPGGEVKEYDAMTLESGQHSDDVWETGAGKKAVVFVGEKTIILKSVSYAGAAIANVSLADESQSRGITIEKVEASFEVTFNSNFYDSVKLIIAYDSGENKELTIVRSGLVIEYLYLEDGPGRCTFGRDCYNRKGPELTYDYGRGEQIAVVATYYHPSDDTNTDLSLIVSYSDGTTEPIEKMAYINSNEIEESQAVNTSYFLLGFAPAHDDEGRSISHQMFKRGDHPAGAINAIVVNAGYDDDETFGGAQIGSGKGVYWNGSIDWFN